MLRGDHDLAFMLQYENVAWYEAGSVKILDRRIYPIKTEFVVCYHHSQVVQAIQDMVTQSAGPYLAAGMGMALAAYECKDKCEKEQKSYLSNAAYALSHARPTTVVRMEEITNKCLQAGILAINQGDKVDVAIFEHTLDEINKKYNRIAVTADYLVEKFPQNGTILTQCFGETIIGLMIRVSQEQGKTIKMLCCETRPYMQGARLTASVAYDQGIDVTVIGDNMAAYAMEQGMVNIFTSAADAISCDGHIINKVGTLQLAILCQYYGIPYLPTGAPDIKHQTVSSVEIEMRNSDLMLEFMGTRVAKAGVKGLYPAFDITPPHLVSGIVTNKGIFSPYDIGKYFKS